MARRGWGPSVQGAYTDCWQWPDMPSTRLCLLSFKRAHVHMPPLHSPHPSGLSRQVDGIKETLRTATSAAPHIPTAQDRMHVANDNFVMGEAQKQATIVA